MAKYIYTLLFDHDSYCYTLETLLNLFDLFKTIAMENVLDLFKRIAKLFENQRGVKTDEWELSKSLSDSMGIWSKRYVYDNVYEFSYELL